MIRSDKALIIFSTIKAKFYLIFGKIKSFLAIEKAHFQYLKSLRKIHKKRKTIKKSDLHLHKGYSKRSIIWNYFLKGNKKFSEIIINN